MFSLRARSFATRALRNLGGQHLGDECALSRGVQEVKTKAALSRRLQFARWLLLRSAPRIAPGASSRSLAASQHGVACRRGGSRRASARMCDVAQLLKVND